MNNVAFQIYGSKRSGIFQSTWKTDNAGTSASNQIELPLLSGGTYNFWIDWGDGSTTNVTSYSQRTHTYASAGTYTIRATGTVGIWRFANGGDKLKILTISSWGKLILGVGTFYGCSNVTMSGMTDVPDLSTVTSFQSTFQGCSNITTVGRINEWNTSTITSAIQMFYGCTLFNSNISNWNVSNITAFNQMFFVAGAFNNGYSYGVVNTLPWVTTNAITFNQMFTGALAFNSNISTFNVSKVTNFTQMFLNANSFNNGYASGVANQLPWTINTTSSVDMSNLFANALAFNSNLGTGTTPWNVSKVTTFSNMFSGASNFNNGSDTAPINNWAINTVSSVSMASMFNSTNYFNRPIDNWNMTKVNNTSGMFAYTRAFNQSLSNWERVGSTMANIIDMSLMFGGNILVFNQDISNWNVSGVTNFSSMFSSNTLFNNGSNTNTNLITGRTGIDGWNINTSSFVNMSSMFSGGGGDSYVTFNRPIGNWNTSKVNNMSYMFSKSGNGNHAFNQYIGDWDTSSVTDMSYMFQANQGDGSTSKFNKEISKWDVSKVTNFSYMLSARQFTNGDNNQQNPITSRIGINGWNINTTATSVNMTSMFQNAFAFNQDISSWNVSKVTNFGNLMLGKTNLNFSSTNLDAIYNGWIVNGVQPNINISFGTAKYTAAGVAGRLTLTSAPNNWIIQDGGL